MHCERSSPRHHRERVPMEHATTASVKAVIGEAEGQGLAGASCQWRRAGRCAEGAQRRSASSVATLQPVFSLN
jgi:hypothetical protein